MTGKLNGFILGVIYYAYTGIQSQAQSLNENRYLPKSGTGETNDKIKPHHTPCKNCYY